MLAKAVMRTALRRGGIIRAITVMVGVEASRDKPITAIAKLGPRYSLLAVQPDQVEKVTS